MNNREQEKQSAAKAAASYIENNMILGLGSGSTAYYLIIEAARLYREGYQLLAVASSSASARIAMREGLPLLDIDAVDRIDLAIDGVDEIDVNFDAIKGGGAALFREKIVASLATEVIWIMDSTKQVERIGAYPLPLELLPYGYTHTIKRLWKLGLNPRLRMDGDRPLRTDNGNYIADLQQADLGDPGALQAKLRETVGVIEDGLFLNACTRIIVGREDGAVTYENPGWIRR